jgi:VanZ family protein
VPDTLRQLLVYWLPLILYVGLIFLLSSLSLVPLPLPAISGADKVVHFGEYAVLAVLVARAIHSLPRPRALWLVCLLTLLVVVAFGALDEAYQSTVPRRQSDALDLLADGLGGLCGSLGYCLFIRQWSLRRPQRTA